MRTDNIDDIRHCALFDSKLLTTYRWWYSYSAPSHTVYGSESRCKRDITMFRTYAYWTSLDVYWIPRVCALKFKASTLSPPVHISCFFLQSMIPFVSFYKNMVSAREWKMWRCDLLRVPLLACWAFQETPAVSFVDVNVTFLRSLSPFDALHFSLRRPRCPFPTRRRSATCTPHAGCTSRWCARVWHHSHVMTGRDQTSGFKSRQGADGGWWRQRPCLVFSLSHIPFWSF